MQEVIEQTWGYVRSTWRFRWYIFLVAWPLCIAGWLFVNQMPDQFKSEARVLVDTSSALRPLLRGLAVQSSVDNGVAIMTRTLMSRPNLEKVARMTDMDLKVNTPEEMDELVTRLSKTIQFKAGRGIGRGASNIYNISYVDEDPTLAKTTVQALLTLFIESTLGDKRKDSDSARKFIEEQVEEYERRLIEAENRLKNFKRKNTGIMPEDGRNYYSQLSASVKLLKQVNLELLQAKKLRDEYKRQLAQEKPSVGQAESQFSIPHPLDVRIETLDTRLDDLLLKFTDQHPDVISTKNTVARLKSKRQKDIDELSKDGKPSEGLSQNPVYQQIKIKLGEAEAIIESIKPRIEDYERSVKRLEGLVDIIPQIEADLKNLNRDYDITKENYDQLLSRRESVKLAEDAEASVDEIKFRIVDPPQVPVHPFGPNRPLFESAVLVVSLATGLAIAFLLSQLQPIYDTPRQLQENTKLRVLGYVSRIWTPQEKRRRRLNVLSFGIVGISLLAVFAGMLTIEILDIDLLASIKRRI